MYIYADVLIITNIYVDFLLIKSTQAITHSPMKTSRCIIASMLGSLFSMVIFLPGLSALSLFIIKFVSAVIIVYASFGYESKRSYIKRLFIFFLASFIYAGIGTAISYASGGRLLLSRNGVIYADFSIITLVITTIAAYICISLYKRLADYSEEGADYTVIVSDNGKTISFKALSDTGNLLKDSFSGKSVIVCDRETLARLYENIPGEDELLNNNPTAAMTGWRLIPYSTASGSGLILIICPKDIYIKNDENGDIFHCDAYLGAAGQHMETAVFHPKILL